MAGQQESRGNANIVTGQPDSWRPDDQYSSSTIEIDRYSIGGKILQDIVGSQSSFAFEGSETLFIVVYDAGYGWTLSSNNKTKSENAYFNYLVNRTNFGSVQNVTFVGSSMGGGLSTVLTNKMLRSSHFANADIQVLTLDGVVNHYQGQLGTCPTKSVSNPLNENGNYKAFKTDLTTYFPSYRLSKVKMYQIIGGSLVVGVGRAFIHRQERSNFDYTYKWVDEEHTDIGRTSKYRNDILNKLSDWRTGGR